MWKISLPVVAVLSATLLAGCSGGSVGTVNQPTKAVYEGPGFSDDEEGGVAYTNTDILIRPSDQTGDSVFLRDRLNEGDPIADGWRYTLYTFTAVESGNRLLELRSDDFDAVIALFRVYPDGYWELIELDDDDGPGTDAAIRVRADRNANYVITVTTYERNTGGDYTLLFERGLSYVTTRKKGEQYDFARPRTLVSQGKGR